MRAKTLLNLGIATSGVPSTIQASEDRGLRQNAEAETRHQKRAEFKQRKQQSDLALQKMQKAAVPGGLDEQQLQLAISEAKRAKIGRAHV